MSGPAPRASFRIEHAHPALPGHFPGAPIVPGVVVLERVLEAAQLVLGGHMRLRGVPQAKFLAPLEPGVEADVVLSDAPGGVRFVVSVAGSPIAQGLLELEAAPR
ncbi:MAG TPA: hydroxymyristoyl-ACP dehydratase [Candidatus Saccharimonadia bacterium]|nr:hydroxymyristoyl-ACP dehydratase [Candidatus Saccharimonadia bacterium]